MKILLTGTAGFIGYHTAIRLLERGDEVIGLDNLNDYYDRKLKWGRLEELGINTGEVQYGKNAQSTKYKTHRFIKLDLEDKEALEKLFLDEKIDIVCHLAAQAGVRYSLTHPEKYIHSNIIGFFNIAECCRKNNIKHLVYASSSSVYGLNESMPYSASDNVDHPISFYAATKKSNELMAHTYSYLYKLPTTGIRFFTVYGPWGRPDMAYFIFTGSIIREKPIDVYNNGNMQRDFTYISDIVGGIVRVIDNPPCANHNWDGKNPDPACSSAPYKLYNIGNNNPVKLMDFIGILENALGKKAKINLLPMQTGDMPATYADISALVHELSYRPVTSLQEGINQFVKWYLKFYKEDI